MRPRALWLLVLVLAGCGDIIGLDGYGDLDGSTIDAPFDAKGDAQADAPADVKDGGFDGPFFEAGCNTLTSVCVPELPSGWSWAVYDPNARVACAAGYDTPTDVEEGLDAGAASCTCGCTTNAPNCATGNITITAGTNGTCDNITTQTDPAAGGCQTLTQFNTFNASISTTGPAPSGGSCAPAPQKTLPPVGYAFQGRTCGFGGTPEGGCPTGNVCMPTPAPFTMCVSQTGSVACPAGFPNQHLVGTKIADTRDCSACGCTFDAGACVGTTTIYTNGGCSSGATAIPATDTCTNIGGNKTWRSYMYAPTSTASCAGTAVSPDGGVAFTDVTTICCE